MRSSGAFSTWYGAAPDREASSPTPTQVKQAREINITFEELVSWKTMMSEYPPAPLVGIDSVNVNFVTTVWRLFLDRKYEL